MNAQQIARLDLALSRGNLTGVSSTYHLLGNEMGNAAPTKGQISNYMNSRPSVQINKTTKQISGKKYNRADDPTAKGFSLVRNRLRFYTCML